MYVGRVVVKSPLTLTTIAPFQQNYHSSIASVAHNIIIKPGHHSIISQDLSLMKCKLLLFVIQLCLTSYTCTDVNSH